MVVVNTGEAASYEQTKDSTFRGRHLLKDIPQ